MHQNSVKAKIRPFKYPFAFIWALLVPWNFHTRYSVALIKIKVKELGWTLEETKNDDGSVSVICENKDGE